MKWIFRHLEDTSRLSLCFGGSKPILEGFANERHGIESLGDNLHTTTFLFTYVGVAISWQSKLQKCVPFFTIEANYIAIID